MNRALYNRESDGQRKTDREREAACMSVWLDGDIL